MKIALLGGSFNPLHIGHCMLAETVIQELGYDKVLFVPVNIPPHKQLSDKVSAQDRFNMIEAFCKSSAEKGKDFFIAEDCELKRGGISYTYDTLEYVIKNYPVTGKPAFIMGQETAAQFHKWHNAEQIAEIADLILARRHPDNNGIDTKKFENNPTGSYTNDFVGDDFEKNFNYSHIMLKNPVLPISSTEIRSRIVLGKGWRYLVPEAVFQYIIDHKLYGSER